MRDPQVDIAIKKYAVYGTPQSVFKEMKEEFGENCLSYSQIKKIRETYRKDILKERQNLTAKLPILDKMERFAYLQQIIDGALEPIPIFNKVGKEIGEYTDRKNALAALKLAHEQTHTDGVVNEDDDELIRSIVQDAYDELKSKNPDLSDADLLDKMLNELPDSAKVFVEELKQEAHG